MQKFRCAFNDTSQTECGFDLPSFCPHCGRSLHPQVMFGSPFGYGYIHSDLNNARAIMIYRCTYEDCYKFWVVEYSIKENTHSMLGNDYAAHPIEYSYTPPITNDLPKNIAENFTDFTDIYNQSLKAEQLHLTKISGIGYRKALEFLIKDYAIKQNPSDKENIKKKFLGKVISDNLKDLPRVQKLAKAANWIGTDEVHYEQRFTNSDVESMKRFIKSAATFISATIDADDAEAFIKENAPKK